MKINCLIVDDELLARRLLIERSGATTAYDTGNHVIHGVAQQQSTVRAGDVVFTSQLGAVALHELHVVPLPDA